MGASVEADDTTMGLIKAAKKTLKRQESGSMKMKHLAKSLLEKFSDSHTKSTVKQVIEEHDMFHVDGKVVMLKKNSSSGGKKRKSSDDDSTEEVEKQSESSSNNNNGDSTKDDKKAAKKEAKKAKKEKKSSTTSSSSAAPEAPDNSSIQAWRTEHKIVLKDPRNDEEGAKATKALATNTQFYPYQTFDAPGCVANINDTLIRQCTVVNGFAKPSPIQAQCWVRSSVFISLRLTVLLCVILHLRSSLLSSCSYCRSVDSPFFSLLIRMGVIVMLSGLQKLDLVRRMLIYIRIKSHQRLNFSHHFSFECRQNTCILHASTIPHVEQQIHLQQTKSFSAYACPCSHT